MRQVRPPLSASCAPSHLVCLSTAFDSTPTTFDKEAAQAASQATWGSGRRLAESGEERAGARRLAQGGQVMPNVTVECNTSAIPPP